MNKFTGSVAVSFIVLLTVATASASSPFVAYNDFGGSASGFGGGNVTSYEANSTGLLVDFSTGEFPGVTMSVSVAVDPPGGALTPGTPAYDCFNGKVNVDGYITGNSWNALTISFTGLDPNRTYEVVLFGDAGQAGWTNRNVYTLRGTDTPSSFVNFSWGDISGANSETATMIAGNNSLTGYIADYYDIAPGADGAFSIGLTATGGNSTWILNALMLATVEDLGGTEAGARAFSVVPEPMSLGLMGIGALAVLRRRRK